MIQLSNVAIAAGGHPLLEGVDWHLVPGAKTGLVGRNGTGKTTLLRVLAGELDVADGGLIRRPGAKIGYLPQQAVSGSEAKLWDEAASGMARLNALEADLNACQAAVDQDPTTAAIAALDQASEAFRLGGGYTKEQTIGGVLHGLGFAPADWKRSCTAFSGGWQMRIALAKLLLSEPDIALLDEPTNHLDLHARSWLAQHVAKAPFTAVIVSHDRYLLDRACTHIAELGHHRLTLYSGNYSAYVRQREERLALAQSTAAKQQVERAKLQGFVERFGAKATKASQARSRKKRLDKLQPVEVLRDERGPRLTLPEAPGCARVALTLSGPATLGFPDEPEVVTGVDIEFDRGMRVAVIGSNGAGKSTLLSALSGVHPPTVGRRRMGDGVRIGVFHQDLAAKLPGEVTGLEHVCASAPLAKPERIRSILGALGLPGESAMRPIGALSGGEKARVALAALAARPCNVLLLDEPTNHLDMQTVEALAAALDDWEGLLVVVSHDRWLLERLCSHVIRVHGGQAVLKEGIEAADFELPEARRTQVTDKPSTGPSYAERKQQQRELERARRRLVEVEDAVTLADAALEKLDAALFEVATDWDKARVLQAERATASQASEALLAEWESLETQIAELEQALEA